MAKIPKQYIREIRDKLGRFPIWPLVDNVPLGSIGIFNGRMAAFSWTNSLADFGISLKATAGGPQISELYTSGNVVNFRFGLGAADIGEAKFGFRRAGAVATQSYKLTLSALPLDRLETELLNKISTGEITWNKRWVIATRIFAAKSFTALISGGRRSKAELATQVPVNGLGFNIADPTLSIGIAAGAQMEYQAVAEGGLEPYFQIHTLAFPIRGDPYLKLYG
jgi:hypothetical protein